MRSNILVAAVAACTLAIGSCKKADNIKVNLAQNYSVVFSPDESKTSAQASFNVYPSMAPVFFNDRSIITANGAYDQSSLTSSSISGFAWSFTGTPDVTFAFKQTDKTIYNTVSRSSMGTLSWAADSAYAVTDTITVSWSGDSLTSIDYLSAYITSTQNTGYWYAAEGAITGNKIVFDYTVTKSFPAGNYQITLVKNRSFEGQNKDGDAPVTINCALYARKTITLY